jgi:hypothetical protein
MRALRDGIPLGCMHQRDTHFDPHNIEKFVLQFLPAKRPC